MVKKDTTLNLQKKLTAHVLIRKGKDTWEIPVCFVYAKNRPNDSNVELIMFQDKANADTQIQITLEKTEVNG